MIVDFDQYKDADYLTIIPSKGRHKNVKRVQELFPNAVFFINEDEVDNYLPYVNLPIITHKQTLGFASVANDIFKRAKENNIRYVAMFDDDKYFFRCLVGNRPRELKVEQIEQVIANGCQVMEDLGIDLYLFSTSSSIIKYEQNKPFKIGFSLPQGAFIVRPSRIHNIKVGMHYYEDFDWLMEHIKTKRYTLIDNRMLCISKGEINDGGCNSFRNQKEEERARAYVEQKWGDAVNFVRNSSGTIRPTCTIPRQKKI